MEYSDDSKVFEEGNIPASDMNIALRARIDIELSL